MIDWYYLQVLFITDFFIWGLNYCFKEGEILGVIGEWMRKHVNDNINKPLFDCPYCMSSVWGTTFYLLFLQPYGWLLWPIFCVCLCGLTAILDK